MPVGSVVTVLPSGVDVLPVDDVEAGVVVGTDDVVGADDVEKKLVIDVSHDDVVVWSGVPVVSVDSVLPADVDVLPFGVVVGADDVVADVDVEAGVVVGADDVVATVDVEADVVVGSAGPVVESFGSVLPAGDVDTLPQRISASIQS